MIVHWAKFYPPEWGGMERVTRDIAAGMAEAGHASTVIAFTRDATAPADELYEGVRVLRAPLLGNPASQPLSVRWMWLAFRQSLSADAVLIHAPNLIALFPLFALCLARLVGKGPKKRILMWHSDIIGKGAAGLLVRPFEHLMALLSTKIVATSPPYAAASAVLQTHRAKLMIIPLGIDPPVVSDAALPPELAAFIKGRPLILSIGRLVPYKGFDVLIDAVGTLSHDAACVIVGSGPLEHGLRARIAAAGLEGRVLLAGGLSATALDSLFRHARLYVMSSVIRSEAFGVVLLEAMSHGLPIVACTIAGSGVPWVAENGENALTVPTFNPEALAGAVSRLLEDPMLATQLGQEGKHRFVNRFTRVSMVTSFLRAVME